jgi:predicted RNA binding protein YcfA (HicA-like mRNA interferase family)
VWLELLGLGTFTGRGEIPYQVLIASSRPATVQMRGELKYREITKLIEQDGWYLLHQVGSHRQYKHPAKAGRVTIAGKPGKDVPEGTLKSILRQAALDTR